MTLVDWLGLLLAAVSLIAGASFHIQSVIRGALAEERLRNASLFAPLIDHIELKSEIRALNKAVTDLTKQIEIWRHAHD